MIQDYFLMATKNLMKKRLRSSLTIIGIFISIATIFVLISLSIGLDNAIKEQFRQLGSDKFIITPKGQAGAPGSGGAVELIVKDAEIVEKVSGVKDISYASVGNAQIEYNNEKRFYSVIGYPLDKTEVFEEMSTFKIEEGKDFKKTDVGKVILGNSYKNANIFKNPVKINDKIFINNKEFKVIGIFESLGNPSDDSSIYIGFKDFQELFSSNERVDQIIVQIKPGENITLVSKNVEKKLMNYRNVDKKTIDFEIYTPEELLKSFGTVLNIITAFLLGVAGISLLVGAVGIANTMYTSVLERTKEIGTMKAIGAKNSDILIIFVIESGVLGLIGGILGIVLGIIVGKTIEFIAINNLGTNLLKVSFPWYLIIGCLLFAFLSGAFSGLFPARSASKLKPADTLRYE